MTADRDSASPSPADPLVLVFTPLTTEALIDALQGWMMDKHIPFDQLDPWADELLDLIRDYAEVPDVG